MAARAGMGSEAEGNSKEEGDGTKLPSSCLPQGYQFDFLNWFYWSLWWQQYSYNWAMYQQQSMMGYPPATSLPGSAPPASDGSQSGMGMRPNPTSDGSQSGTGTRPNQELGGNADVNRDQQSQQQPAPQQQPYAWGQPPFYQPWNWNMPQFAAPFQYPGTRMGQVYLRIVAGYETYIAPFWRRCAAEFIDTVLFTLLLKMYQPDIDLRIPEIVFKGSDVWLEMDDDDLMDVKDLLTWFLISSVMERLFHAVLEAAFLVLFACTPGKWVMGLRVWSCTTSHLTRTAPGYSIRVHPGGRLSPLLALLRSLFKAAVSLFIPMVIFFFYLTNGRTMYDKWFGSTVVDTYSLRRPIYSTNTTGGSGVRDGHNQLNNNVNVAGEAAPAQNRLQFHVG